MKKIFIKALAWNSSATFLYKIALLMHQITLYSVISHTLYGLQSTLFALIYTIIALTNFGFEETLLPFFSIFTQSKQQFRQTWLHFVWHSITIASLACILYYTLLYGPGEFLHNIQLYCNKNIILLCSLLFFVESIKKTIIAMMQLAFLNKQIVYASLSMLFAYIATVWTIFTITGQLTLYNIFIPMIIFSTLELWYVSYQMIQFYNSLATVTSTIAHIPFNLLFKQRIYNYTNQIIKTLYSPNCMTLFFAYILGFQQAATIKFFTNIITLCYTCISKTIGVTTGAALSTMNSMPLPAIQSFFKEVTYRYFQLLCLLSIILMIIIGYSSYYSIITNIMAWHITLFFVISLLENISITYEQLFISQHAAKVLAVINSTGLVLLGMSGWLYYSYNFNPIILLSVGIIIKIISLLSLNIVAYQRWGISIK